MLRVIYLHGTNGSPSDPIAESLYGRYRLFAPALPLSNFTASVHVVNKAIVRFQPHIIIAYDYGSAVAYELVKRGLWFGPVMMISPMFSHQWDIDPFPNGLQLMVVYGNSDETTQLDKVVKLTRMGSPNTSMLRIMNDGHEMNKLSNDMLDDLIQTLVNLGKFD